MDEKKIDKQKKDETLAERSMFVVKSNSLIHKTRYTLTLEEQRILLYLISKIKPDDEKLAYQDINISKYCDVCGIDISKYPNMYSYIKDTIQGLADKSFWIMMDNGKEILLRWIDTAIAEKQSGVVSVKLKNELIPYLLEIKENYTQFSLLNVIAMKSKYSPRLYELLRADIFRGTYNKTVIYTIKELQDKLGIADDNSSSYKDNITMFRKFCIERAIEEINKYTDIFVEVEYLKTGRTIDRAKFDIRELQYEKAIGNSYRADRELDERLGQY